MSAARTVTRTIYVTLRKSLNYWNTPAVCRMTKKSPKLKAGELAVKIELQIPENIFDLPSTALVVSPDNLVRPEVSAS